MASTGVPPPRPPCPNPSIPTGVRGRGDYATSVCPSVSHPPPPAPACVSHQPHHRGTGLVCPPPHLHHRPRRLAAMVGPYWGTAMGKLAAPRYPPSPPKKNQSTPPHPVCVSPSHPVLRPGLEGCSGREKGGNPPTPGSLLFLAARGAGPLPTRPAQRHLSSAGDAGREEKPLRAHSSTPGGPGLGGAGGWSGAPLLPSHVPPPPRPPSDGIGAIVPNHLACTPPSWGGDPGGGACLFSPRMGCRHPASSWGGVSDSWVLLGDPQVLPKILGPPQRPSGAPGLLSPPWRSLGAPELLGPPWRPLGAP